MFYPIPEIMSKKHGTTYNVAQRRLLPHLLAHMLIQVTTVVCSVCRPEVIKLFSCSTQLSIKFELLINDKIAQIN